MRTLNALAAFAALASLVWILFTSWPASFVFIGAAIVFVWTERQVPLPIEKRKD